MKLCCFVEWEYLIGTVFLFLLSPLKYLEIGMTVFVPCQLKTFPYTRTLAADLSFFDTMTA